MRKHRLILLCISTAILWGGCISVNLSSDDVERSSEVSVSPPPRSFQRFESPGTDRAWRHQESGNTISYVTECSKDADLSLKEIQKGIVAGINDLNTLERNNLTYNAREALRTIAKGQVEGVETQFDILVFKKNGCIYVLTYVGEPEAFQTYHKDFEAFVRGFRVP